MVAQLKMGCAYTLGVFSKLGLSDATIEEYVCAMYVLCMCYVWSPECGRGE